MAASVGVSTPAAMTMASASIAPVVVSTRSSRPQRSPRPVTSHGYSYRTPSRRPASTRPMVTADGSMLPSSRE
jgi:hypothetical protein